MIGTFIQTFAQIQNCPTGSGANCLTTIPNIEANQSALSTFLGLLFGVLAAISVIIIVIQGIKFSTSQGDPQKATDARRAIIYAIVGLVVSLSAEAVVRLVISKI